MSFLERWWDRFLENPERNSTIFAVVFLVQVIPLFYPLGLPMPYSFYTKDWVAVFDGGTTSYGVTFPGVQPGDIVIWGSLDEHASSWSTGRDWYAVPVMLAIGERGGKFIFANLAYSSISIYNDLISRYINRYYPELQYGDDYLISEYIPGAEAAIKQFADNLGAIHDAKNDKPINSYPAFAHVNTMAEVNYAWGTVIRTTDHDMFTRQWAMAYPTLNYITTAGYDVVAPYYGNIVKACPQYSFEIESAVGAKYGAKFYGEQILRIEAQELGVLMYIPLLVWAFYVNWKRAIAQGVSLRPDVGARGA